jgi:hypothetical protein
MGKSSLVFLRPWAEKPDGPTPLLGPVSAAAVDSAQSNNAILLFPFELFKFNSKSSLNF